MQDSIQIDEEHQDLLLDGSPAFGDTDEVDVERREDGELA